MPVKLPTTAELAALGPRRHLAGSASAVGPLLQATRTVPIVFPINSDRSDPAVDSLARPGNATGFIVIKDTAWAKLLELLFPSKLWPRSCAHFSMIPGVSKDACIR
jgi:hypothetical protein